MMKTEQLSFENTTISIALFKAGAANAEFHITVSAPPAADIAGQLDAVAGAYRHALERLGLTTESALFRRIFVSDYANQRRAIHGSPLHGRPGEPPTAISVVEQPPLPGGRFALFAYHVADGVGAAKHRRAGSVATRRGSLTHIWSTGLKGDAESSPFDAGAQTTQIFDAYEAELAGFDACLRDDVIRTWLYVHNVDANYGDMVAARRARFEARGLTQDTHYIASTGIEGRTFDARHVVLLDGYAVRGLSPEQVRFLHAEDRLGPTISYGVTFERGTSIDYRDRRHIFLSGTASIDPQGNVCHEGDVSRQLERTLDNAESLLSSAGARLEDIAHLFVYLRDHADYGAVSAAIGSRFQTTPTLYLRAPVCRPAWLVEIECVAVVEADNPALAPY